MAGKKMTNILDISTEGRYLCLSRGFVRICEKDTIVADVPLDILTAVIVTGNGSAFSGNVLAEFASRNIPVVFCGDKYTPVGILLGIEGHCRQTEIMIGQVEMTIPFQKNSWKIIVEAKIKNQIKVLDIFGKEYSDIEQISNRVCSGDTTNCEAIAARAYFPRLFGDDFRRTDIGNRINGFLNYGYAVIRAAMARYVVAAGLLPSFSLHHRNMLNPFCLVDDLMEPYRPVVDMKTYELTRGGKTGSDELTPEHKKALAALLEKSVKTKECESPVNICMQKTVWSLVESIKSKEPALAYEKNIV